MEQRTEAERFLYSVMLSCLLVYSLQWVKLATKRLSGSKVDKWISASGALAPNNRKARGTLH